jgi:Mg-chelatase subunit ChlD
MLINKHCITERLRVDVALVIDSSSSMRLLTSQGRAKLEAALEAVERFLWLLDLPHDRAAVVEFNESARVLQPLTGDGSSLVSALGEIEIKRGTRLHLGLASANALLPSGSDDVRRAPVLILLTDGKSDPDPVSLALVEADKIKARGIALFTIGLGDDVDEGALRNIASHPGYYYQTPDAEDLDEVYRQVARDLPCP